ncbi:MAG: efflux transporter outer membrane subunit [Desulfovibrio sp.]|jgi:Cu(I)/Ag(I) efflux system outer membrane protein|nr:efflux transporter outer membrane subunit [Desulfovibrio sp.]
MRPYCKLIRNGLCFAVVFLSACSLAPVYTRPEAPVPEQISAEIRNFVQADGTPVVTWPIGAGNVQASPAANVAHIGWVDFFKDPRLRELIAISLRHNRDVRMSALAVEEARAQYGIQRAERLPRLETVGQGDYSGKVRERHMEILEVGLMPSFELDFFGRIKSMSESALQAYLASREAEKTMRISLVAQVAESYLNECLAGEQLQLARNNLVSWRKSYAFVERRVQSGQSSLLDLEQARSMVEFATATVAGQERQLIQSGNALRLLSGSFVQQNLPPAQPLRKQSLAALPSGLPSSVLLERPDVLEVEHRLLAANADIGAARAAFFPSVNLTGSLGYMSEDLNRLIVGSNALWSFLPKISLPIFAGGGLEAGLDLSEARKESSVAAYEKVVQTAFTEVADALQSRASFDRQLKAQERYLASQRTVLDLAMNRYVNGAVSYLEVLDAQRVLYQTEQDLLAIRREQLLNEIRLYKALGGGLNADSVISASYNS